MSDFGNEFIEANSEFRQKFASSGVNEVPATKEFVVNATGNLFVATTLNGGADGDSTISEEAKTAFGQVSVFFAAMTKAMAEEEKSLFDYMAINNVVSTSGLFIKVTDSNVRFTSQAWGVKLGNQLVQTLFGLSGNLGAIGKSLMSMVGAIGKEANGIEVSSTSQTREQEVGTIIFVCEYLLGAISITPIVFKIDSQDASDAFEASVCFKAHKKTIKVDIVKQVYMFVPPEFIKQAGVLNEAMESEEFDKLVESLREAVKTPQGE
ncbi:hypothetical protein HG263_20220 [Pseudoalteromonas sp. JBTF-M23]|uniref:Uncharacterized protein n=1 Tax=Pseudoalteromonas caenipelagi TaxID=2726988 RepID=A0A849VJL5_9GAMM|nr:hypothetical protein [Pseudoalteromonas caenipelagi]NOU52838.1 hypothetical protein [Pseudoalteromonas caenipelagi]